jgi:hypothetical protein
MIGGGFEGDGTIDLRLSQPMCGNKYKQSGENADDHAADKQATSQGAFR